MGFNIEKYKKIERELEQKANLLNRLKQEKKTADRKAETRRKIILGGTIDLVDKKTSEEYLKFANDLPLLVGILTNNLLYKRILEQADFLRGEGNKRLEEWKPKKKGKGGNKDLGSNTHYLVKRKNDNGTYFDVEDKKDE